MQLLKICLNTYHIDMILDIFVVLKLKKAVTSFFNRSGLAHRDTRKFPDAPFAFSFPTTCYFKRQLSCFNFNCTFSFLNYFNCQVLKQYTINIVSFNESTSMKHLLHRLHSIYANLTTMNGTCFLMLDCLQS